MIVPASPRAVPLKEQKLNTGNISPFEVKINYEMFWCVDMFLPKFNLEIHYVMS